MPTPVTHKRKLALSLLVPSLTEHMWWIRFRIKMKVYRDIIRSCPTYGVSDIQAFNFQTSLQQNYQKFHQLLWLVIKPRCNIDTAMIPQSGYYIAAQRCRDKTVSRGTIRSI